MAGGGAPDRIRPHLPQRRHLRHGQETAMVACFRLERRPEPPRADAGADDFRHRPELRTRSDARTRTGSGRMARSCQSHAEGFAEKLLRFEKRSRRIRPGQAGFLPIAGMDDSFGHAVPKRERPGARSRICRSGKLLSGLSLRLPLSDRSNAALRHEPAGKRTAGRLLGQYDPQGSRHFLGSVRSEGRL